MADLTELFAGIVKHLTRKSVFYGFYPYRVQEQVNDRASLQAVGSTEGLPDVLFMPKAHGLAGAREQCAKDSIVLVGFEGGSPKAPFIAFYLPALPTTIDLDATSTITLGGAGAVAAARAPELQTWADAVTTALGQIATILNAMPGPVVSAPGSVTPAPALSAAVAALKVKIK